VVDGQTVQTKAAAQVAAAACCINSTATHLGMAGVGEAVQAEAAGKIPTDRVAWQQRRLRHAALAGLAVALLLRRRCHKVGPER